MKCLHRGAYIRNIRDQIIEGLVDGNTVGDLLQQKDLTQEAAITKCRAQEAAKRQRPEMTRDASETIYAVGKLLVTFQIGTIKHKNELHIHQEVTGELLSWEAAKGVNILPECYPHPINTTLATAKTCLLASKVHPTHSAI